MIQFPAQKPNLLQRLVKYLAALQPISKLLAPTLHRVDRLVLRLSGGRMTATSLLTGLQVVMLTSTGARSGEPRSVPLLAAIDGEKVILFGTNFGGRSQPAWVYNLRANPLAWLEYRDQRARYRAREAEPAERQRYWQQVQELYPGYSRYRQRASHRQIAVLVLEPVVDGTA